MHSAHQITQKLQRGFLHTYMKCAHTLKCEIKNKFNGCLCEVLSLRNTQAELHFSRNLIMKFDHEKSEVWLCFKNSVRIKMKSLFLTYDAANAVILHSRFSSFQVCFLKNCISFLYTKQLNWRQDVNTTLTQELKLSSTHLQSSVSGCLQVSVMTSSYSSL